MKRNFNLPFDKIHDPLWSYGTLLCPVPWSKCIYGENRWLMIVNKNTTSYRYSGKRILKTDINGFHNCTKTNIY